MYFYSYTRFYLSFLGLLSVTLVSEAWEDINFRNNLGPFAQPTTVPPADSCEAVEGPYKNCACVMQKTGGIINLNAIINNCSYAPRGCITPRFIIKGSDGWTYAFHPCADFSLFQNETHVYPGYRPCKNVASARYTRLSTHECDGLGKQANSSFKIRQMDKANFITSNLTLEFHNKTTKNSAIISLVCNSSIPANESVMTFLGIKNYPYNAYFMSLESECCCPDGCFFAYTKTDKRNFTPTKDFWYIIAIAGGIILLLIICVLVVACRKKTNNSERKPLLDPLT